MILLLSKTGSQVLNVVHPNNEYPSLLALDFQFEVIHVTIAISFSFEDFDFVVDPLHTCSGDGMSEVSQKSLKVPL